MSGTLRRDRKTRNWARGLVAANHEAPPLRLIEAVAARVGKAIDPSASVEPLGGPVPLAVELGHAPPEGWANPWLPGIVHEQAVSPERRAARGAWYTPQSVVTGLVSLAMPTDRPCPDFIVDPTCGGGAFLLAVLDQLVVRGIDPARAVTMVAGLDIDAGAAVATRLSIRLWAADHDTDVELADIDVRVGDALSGYPNHWPRIELLVGNPPFASPLRAGAVPVEAAAFRQAREHLLGPYADLAAIHLLAAVERCQGATVALVQPQSVLAGRDTTGLRLHCNKTAPLRALWAAREAVFDAGVRACGLVLRPGDPVPAPVTLAAGPDVEPCGTVDDIDHDRPAVERSWSALAATALGAPDLPSAMAATDGDEDRLGSLVTATAGFRDEYYGLVAACREWTGTAEQEPNRLVTVGAVEPLATLWADEDLRFGGRSWLRPFIDMADLDEKVLAWTQRQLRPKVVLATQSRILEPVIDRSGGLVPATPLVAVHAEPADLNRVAAVLLAPPVVAWAWKQWFGTALAVDALKLAAKQVARLPLPADHGAWDEAATILDGGTDRNENQAEAWERACTVAMIMNRAYGADPSVYSWWLERSRRPKPAAAASDHAG